MSTPAPEAPSSYLVCASQRSGSTLLVESLRLTGVAGNPGEYFQYLPHSGLSPRPREWFAGVEDESVLALLPPLETGTPDLRTSDEWADDLRGAGRSDNGVWGGKLMWNQVPNLLQRSAGLTGRSGDDLRSAISDVLGEEPLYVHVRRTDVVPQAVSMWRAVQTQVWRGSADPDVDARAQYHADGIAHLAAILLEQDAGWLRWFDDEGIEPYRVDFEELAADSAAVTSEVLQRLGLDPALAPPPPLRRQSNDRSSTWVERYRADAETRSLPR